MAGISGFGTETVGLPWIVVLAFLRLTTRTGLFQKPLTVKPAFDLVDVWLQAAFGHPARTNRAPPANNA